jgi:muramidase (phage lysozyme)
VTTKLHAEPQALSFAFPFRDVRGQQIVDEHVFYGWLANEGNGRFPVSGSGMWHGGIHVSMNGAGQQVDLEHGVRCIAAGEIIAYRINRTALESHVVADGNRSAQVGLYSSAFTLVRHALEYPVDNRLTFFSLYMHLQSVSEYAQRSALAPAYWVRSYEVTRYAADKQKVGPHHGGTVTPQTGLNIHADAGGAKILAILPRGAKVRIGEKRKNGQWGRIEVIESGVPMPPRVAGYVLPDADKGWVYLGKERGHELLVPVVSEARCDEVVVPPKPVPVKAGELIGHLGQYWQIDNPEREHRMVHIEVFCGDELPHFLAGSRAAANKIIDFDKLPLLRIDKGVKLFERPSTDGEGARAPETAVVQIYSQPVLEALPEDSKGAKDDALGDGQRWWRVTSANSRYEDIIGWIRNRQMPPNGGVTRESPHAWKDFEAITGADAGNPTIFSSVDAWLDHVLCEDKPATGDIEKLKPVACNLYRALSTMRSESQAADEIRALNGHKWLTFRASRLIPKHRSEWSSHSEYLDFFQKVLARVAKEPYHDAEIERINRLIWWDDVRNAVKGAFPSSPDVFHIHPIALVANFPRISIPLEEARVRAFLRMIRVGEGTEGADGYERLFGGESFVNDYGKDFSDHPRLQIARQSAGRTLRSSAAGAYQVMGYTWDDPQLSRYRKTYGINDFSPASQDRFCVILLKFKRHAIESIKEGNVRKAVFDDRCNLEWASLPGDMYGQGGVSMDTVGRKFSTYLDDELSGKSDLAVAIGGLSDLID